MITGKLADIISFVLPMFYRKCPMGNAHTRNDKICNCCQGNEFVWIEDKWWLLKYAPLQESHNHSSLSWSGQLSSGELWGSAIKQGLILAVVFGIITTIIMLNIQHAFQHVKDTKIKSIGKQND